MPRGRKRVSSSPPVDSFAVQSQSSPASSPNDGPAQSRRRPRSSSASASASGPGVPGRKKVARVSPPDGNSDSVRSACKALQQDNLTEFSALVDSKRISVSGLIASEPDLDIDDWTTFLHQSARYDALQCMKYLLERRVDPNIEDEMSSTALDEAALYGKVEAAKLLISYGASLEAQNNRNSSSLSTAASEGESHFLEWLLTIKACKESVNQKNKEGRSALSFACSASRNSLQCVQMLLSNGASLMTRDTSHNTPLHWAVFYGNWETVRFLCRFKEINPVQPNKFGITPFDYWGWDQVDAEVDEEGNLIDEDGQPISLHEICRERAMDWKKGIGIGPASEDDHDETSEAAAADEGQNKEMEVEEKNGRNTRKRRSAGQNKSASESSATIPVPGPGVRESKCGACKRIIFQELLLLAVMKGEYGDAEEVNRLLKQRRRLAVSRKYRMFPMDYTGYSLSPQQVSVAFEDDNTEILQILLDHGLDFQRASQNGFMPIHEAANVGNRNAVALLLSHGVNPDVQELNDGYRCLALASDDVNGVGVAELLIQSGADVNATDYHGNTALHWAVFRCNIPMVKYLLGNSSVNRTQRNKWGNAPLHYAFYRAFKSLDNLECLKTLLEAGLVASEPRNEQGQAPKDIIAGFHTERGKIALEAAGMEPSEGAKWIEKYLAEWRIDGSSSAAGDKAASERSGSSSGFGGPWKADSKRDKVITSDLVAYRERERKKQEELLSEEPKFHMSDLSGGNEGVKIPLINTIDNTKPDLQYIRDVLPHIGVELPVLRSFVGTAPGARKEIMGRSRCQCKDDCDSPLKCGCIAFFQLNGGGGDSQAKTEIQDPAERLKALLSSGLDLAVYERNKGNRAPFRPSFVSSNCRSLEMLVECNELCGCSASCSNRFTDRGVSVQLQVYKTREKGWAARAMQDIPIGTFVSEYVGELISESEAQQRMKDYDIKGIHYLFGIRESPYVLDPYKKGNVARFFNHSCEPNLTKIQIYRHLPGPGTAQDAHSKAAAQVPRMAFFAARDIAKGEELCISYDYEELEYPGGCLVCYCGADKCRNNLV